MNAAQEHALIQFIYANIGRPFAWGLCDCNTFVLEAQDAAFGCNLAELITGQYTTALGAIRYRLKSRWKRLDVLLAEAGYREIPAGFQQTGDILIVTDHRWEMSHVCLGATVASVFPNAGVQTALIRLLRQPYRVWRSPQCLLP